MVVQQCCNLWSFDNPQSVISADSMSSKKVKPVVFMLSTNIFLLFQTDHPPGIDAKVKLNKI